MLIDQQINFYRKNGYLIVKNIFTDKEALEFNQLIRRHTNKDFAAIVNPDRFEQLAEQDEKPKSDIRLEEIKETASYSLKIMKNPKIRIGIFRFSSFFPIPFGKLGRVSCRLESANFKILF